jgi:eukaryotic-like serine/threonine-protein kinase
MASATGLRKKLNPALLVGLPYREGEVMAGRYLVKDAVGVGPLGFVLRAADRELGIDVSVKLIHPRFVQTAEEREAFTRALEPARRFLHPSLTRLHDVGNEQGWPYFTYTFLDGLPLRRIIDLRLAKGQTFALDEVEPILGQLMAALEAAHPAGAHGDLKAENILVLPDMLKVTDWGVAAGVPRPPFVQAERQKSAHRHFAPEYLAGLGLEPRADVYSLGVLVGEMLTGLTPEDEVPELRLVNPELPDAIEGFYRRALSEHPASRFRSVREMFEAFSAGVEGKPAPAEDAVQTAADEGFEVVDFNETQTVVVQPEPPPPAPEVVQPEARADVPAPSPVVAAAEVAAPPAEAPVLATAAPAVDSAPVPAEPEAPEETEFWSESKEAPAPEAPEASKSPSVGTLWSDEEEDEAHVAPEPVAPALSLAAAPPEPPPAKEAVPPPEAPPVEPEPPAVRAIPAAPSVPRIGSASLPSAAVSRPVVPSVGLWGPGARRTGAHAAVAVAIPEAPGVEPVSPPAAAAPELPFEEPAPAKSVRPVPTPAPFPAVAHPPERPLAPASVALQSVGEAQPLASAPEGAGGHQGGQWSPGAALAELVSELRTEDARRLAEADGEAASVARAAEAATEQRASRERLALMSASDEPTVPVASVSGRPHKPRPAPRPLPTHRMEFPVDRLLRWGLLGVVVFFIGVAGMLIIHSLH